MSTPKVGDRVRVVIEDTIDSIDECGAIFLASVCRWAQEGVQCVVSIEVIPEPFVLPTKRWAQVLDCAGNLWTLPSPGWVTWLPLDKIGWIRERDLMTLAPLRVISEGVDE
jgi:hypothetical protein